MRTIVVGTPSCRDPKWDYVSCLLPTAFSMAVNPEMNVMHKVIRNALITDARTMIVRQALAVNASHIFWVDDDMVWPPEALKSLLAHKLPIVAANCVTRKLPCQVTARKDGKPLYSNGKSGLEEVDGVGMAVMLTETRIFREIPEPWFATGYDPADAPTPSCTEDIYFCLCAKEKGFKVYVDHDLSQQVGHVGEMTYHHGLIRGQ